MVWSAMAKLEPTFRCRAEIIWYFTEHAKLVLVLRFDQSVKYRTSSGNLLIISDE